MLERPDNPVSYSGGFGNF
jgi:hypothetical protein